jgi:hypothetical protein
MGPLTLTAGALGHRERDRLTLLDSGTFAFVESGRAEKAARRNANSLMYAGSARLRIPNTNYRAHSPASLQRYVGLSYP